MWYSLNNWHISLLLVCFAASLKVINCFLCNQEFCDTFLEENDCPNIPENCEIQNSTHNGLVLPYPGPCNCCEYCIENLEKGDQCALGGIYNPLPGVICGDSLMCTNITSIGGECHQLMSRCTLAQRDFDYRKANGLLGYMELRPNCDYGGLYENYKCVPGEICYCVDPYGNRIFGEIPYTQHPKLFMDCGCSRSDARVRSFLGELHADQHFRCLSNGDYDPLQCIDGACFCVHKRDGLSSIDKQKLVNISTIAEKNPSCFDSLLHNENDYYKPCEQKYLLALEEIKKYEEEDEIEVFGFVAPNCQLDGRYAPIQTTKLTKYCSDPNGKLIEDYSLAKSDPDALTMDCKCARIRYLAEMEPNIEKPDCCSNGNYRAVQCRRGLCRCVDNNGNQIGLERDITEIDKLPCINKECT